ncbi:phosphoesterase [Sphingomonas glaciei]|uniref:Phosphoesterase n=1 Tax=Sphingomonas glaciei TaxID=2938948 RepID=A0ABY5MTC2_9SPHN|nr:phosphoesterase [Sphingomonas glaciei]UUR07418.1 phosphoesterase [Sphingomonas glaciei]
MTQGPQPTRERFRQWLDGVPGPPLILGHFDADGLSAVAILARSIRGSEVRLVGKGETPWTDAVRAELEQRRPPAIIATDLGVREGEILPGTPTCLLDHHVPTGTPGDALVLSGNGDDPEPTSALLAFWTLGSPDDLLWLAAMGLIGDMAEDKGFAEMAAAQARYGKTALRNAVSLVNAPRRTASADASPALSLLMKCDSPKELLSGAHPETGLLLAAKEEVKAAMEVARRVAPKVRGEVALIPLDSPCQVHPLIAQQWRTRLRDKVVIAANKAYRPGWVHFAARTGAGHDLIRFFADRRPDGVGTEYGSGHKAASGGALRIPDWNRFVAELGFPEEQIA